MHKQFTKKEIEKRFKVLYPEGEINLINGKMWYCENENSRCIDLHCSNLYDVASKLMLATKQEIDSMKRLAGYTSYK